jgi:hypothetical protein
VAPYGAPDVLFDLSVEYTTSTHVEGILETEDFRLNMKRVRGFKVGRNSTTL